MRKPKALSRGRLLLAAIAEPFTRVVGFLAGILGRDPEGVEASLRGRLLGGNIGWRVGRAVRFVGPPGRIRLGENVTLYGDIYINGNGANGFVEVGADTHIDQSCIMYGQGGLEIGADCAIASGVIIYTQTNSDALKDGTPVSRQAVVYRKVKVGDACWLGAGVRVIPGVEIGRGAHVGAGAVVIRFVSPGDHVAGVPAKPIERRS